MLVKHAGEEKKLLFLDVGLTSHLLGLNWTDIQHTTESRLVNEGVLAEQFIGQHLLDFHQGTQTPELNYWLREGKANNAEVDYVIAHGDKIYPVEVKAGKSGSLKSLHQYILQKDSSLAFRFDLNPPRRQALESSIRLSGTQNKTGKVSYSLISLPLYAVEEMPRLCQTLAASD